MANTSRNKYGGRAKETPNKLTKKLRSVLKEVIYNGPDNIEKRLDQLEPKQRLELVIKLILMNFQRWNPLLI